MIPSLSTQTPDGREYGFQPSLAKNPVISITPANGSTNYLSYGQYAGTVGTVTSIVPSDDLTPFMGNLAASSVLNNQVTPNTTNIFCGVSANSPLHCRGSNANGFGGFFYFARILFPDSSYSSTRILVGMYRTYPSTDNKSWWDGYATSTDNPDGTYAAFQYSTARSDSTWQFVTKDGTTQNVTAISGASFLVNKLYDFHIYCPRAGSTISYRLDNVTDGTTYSGSTSTNLPPAYTYMQAGFQLRATAVNGSNLRWNRLYVE